MCLLDIPMLLTRGACVRAYSAAFIVISIYVFGDYAEIVSLPWRGQRCCIAFAHTLTC